MTDATVPAAAVPHLERIRSSGSDGPGWAFRADARLAFRAGASVAAIAAAAGSSPGAIRAALR